MNRIFVDTNVLLYAVGGASPHRDACRRVLDAATRSEIQLHCSTELLQEFLFHRLRRTDRVSAVEQTRSVHRMCVQHPFDGPVVSRMLELVESSLLRGRDAVHVATAQLAGFDRIVTLDADLVAMPRFSALDPREAI